MSSVNKRYGISRFKDRKARNDFVKAYHEAFASFPRPETTYDIETTFGLVRVYHYENEHTKTKVPIVLLHGRYASSLMWKENLPALIREFPVYMVEIIGEANLSIQAKPFIKSKDQAMWLEETLSKLKLDKISLIGASMGGWAAANYIRYYPKRVKNLILLDPVFVFSPISMQTVIQFLVFQLFKDRMLPFLLNNKKVQLIDPLGQTVKIGMNQFIYRTPVPCRIKVRDLKKIHCPVLTVMAGKSLLHDSEKAAVLGRAVVKRIEMENWKYASHALNFEHSEAVNRRILSFLIKNEHEGTLFHLEKPVYGNMG